MNLNDTARSVLGRPLLVPQLGWREDAGPQAAPISLTASDGTGLRLVSLTVHAVVQDPLAFTELHLVFENPRPRRLEGRFEITLPDGAAISRFAMRIGGRWQEGEVLEKQRARRVYEDFLHKAQDPALLEKQPGNAFRARVFPIEAGERKALILSYSHALRQAGDPYRVALQGLPRMEAFAAHVQVDTWGSGAGSPGAGDEEREVFSVEREDFQPTADLEIAFPGLQGAVGLRADDLALARTRLHLDAPPQPVTDLIALLDTSASRALGFSDALADLRALAAALPPQARLRLLCFDQEVHPAWDGPAGEFGATQIAAIAERGALGASDLEGALATLQDTSGARVLLITDGIFTAGSRTTAKLGATLEALDLERVDAVVCGGIRDGDLLMGLVQGHAQTDGLVMEVTPAEIAEKLGCATGAVTIDVPGADWCWPQSLDGVQSGDEVLVFAGLEPDAEFRVVVASAQVDETIATARVPRPLLERAAAGADIARLAQMASAAKTGEARAAAVAAIVERSVRFRVLSDHTALLVLETEADYARHGISREALADILVVTPEGLAAQGRDAFVVPQPQKQTKRPDAKKGLRKAKVSRRQAPAGRTAERVAEEVDLRSEPDLDFAATLDDDDAEVDLCLEAGDEPDTGAMGGAVGAAPPEMDGFVEHSTQPAPAREMAAPPPSTRPPSADRPSAGCPAMPPPSAGPRAAPPPSPMTRPVMSAPMPQPMMSEAAPRSAPAAARSSSSSILGAAGRLLSRAGEAISDLLADDEAPEPVAEPAPEPAPEPRPQRPRVRNRRLDSNPRHDAPVDQRPPSTPASNTPNAPTPNPPTPKVPEAPGPWTGELAEIKKLLADGLPQEALARARAWRDRAPGDVLALVALGEALAALGDRAGAARAYGSIIDLFASRADLRRWAGQRLEALGVLDLAADTYRAAREQRPDHPNSHRMLAWALHQRGEHAEAFAVLAEGLGRSYPSGRFSKVKRVMAEDLGLLAAAWKAAGGDTPETDAAEFDAAGTAADSAAKTAAEIDAALKAAGGAPQDTPTVRFLLSWETDANDVDIHVHDARGGHAYYSSKVLPSGGELYADITNGFGPECFTISGQPAAAPYRLRAHYYSRGPMGYGMGVVHIITHDGAGTIEVEARPFVIMKDRAYVEMGRWSPT